jgi:hypothetical protein
LTEYEKLLRSPPDDAKKLIIKAYEKILTDKRKYEKDLLNAVRFEEYEKNRPPEKEWYMIKHKGFSKELYRNRVALKPNNENASYLERL